VLPAAAYVISDSHLGFATRDIERSMLRFLRYLHGRAGSLVINGDLFEFWFEWKHVMPRRGFRVLAALADLVDAGVPVLMVAGNHDCWGGEILRTDVGIDFRTDPWEGVLGGWRARVEHGDGLREREDRGYRRLRRVLRNPLSIRLFRWLHPDLGSARIGDAAADHRPVATRLADLRSFPRRRTHSRRLRRVRECRILARPANVPADHPRPHRAAALG
jgi:UDP-2,3-diacylglucosamine hydrolase